MGLCKFGKVRCECFEAWSIRVEYEVEEVAVVRKHSASTPRVPRSWIASAESGPASLTKLDPLSQPWHDIFKHLGLSDFTVVYRVSSQCGKFVETRKES